MLTPAQLKAYEFKQAGRNAYKADDVDDFFGSVLVDYEKMFRENSELIKRLNLLANKLEEYKNDESQIKDAVMSAQKAAKVIVQEAEESVVDSKTEAEAILAAAKGEADIIIADAEKQAIADAELALSVARDKAEEIIAKAKEKAHGILIAANDSASNTVGAATRTITSESLHYDMLKKEVSEFRASILSQYKAHIELISKLPELAVEQALKIDKDGVVLPEKSVDEIEAYVDNGFSEPKINDGESVLEFVEDTSDFNEEDTQDGEPVVKTELPYDFFANDTSLEYIDEKNDDFEEDVTSIEDFNNVDEAENDADNSSIPADIPISRKFKIDFSQFDNQPEKAGTIDKPQFNETEHEQAKPENDDNADNSTVGLSDVSETESESVDSEVADTKIEDKIDDDFGYEDDDEYDLEEITSRFFENIEKIDAASDGVDNDNSSKKKFGLFKKKK